MSKEIEIAITKEEDLYEKYNKNYVNKGLIDYIIDKALMLKKEDEIKIIITSTLSMDINYEELIKEGLTREYKKSLIKHKRNNYFQIFYLVMGILFLLLSRIVSETIIFGEIFLIGGWVLIWEVVELSLLTNFEENLKRKLLKKLINSLIIENR